MKHHWRIQGGAPGTRAPPWGSKFFHFHAVFGKNVKNNSNFGSWRPPLGKILDPPLNIVCIVKRKSIQTSPNKILAGIYVLALWHLLGKYELHGNQIKIFETTKVPVRSWYPRKRATFGNICLTSVTRAKPNEKMAFPKRHNLNFSLHA